MYTSIGEIITLVSVGLMCLGMVCMFFVLHYHIIRLALREDIREMMRDEIEKIKIK